MKGVADPVTVTDPKPEVIESKDGKDAPTSTFSNASKNAHVEFNEKFQREANEYDKDIFKRYGDLDTTLIFAGLLSTVTTVFIVDIQRDLRPDYDEMNFAVLQLIAAGATSVEGGVPRWNGPSQGVVHVQAILYSSLCASFTAAFVAILGRQWLNHYAKPERGSSIDSIRNRKLKMDGMDTWRFNLVMDFLPLMLQAALALLGSGLSYYLFFLNQTVAGVVIGFTSFCLFFYTISSFAATFSRHCPYQTPLSLALRHLAHRWLPKRWCSRARVVKPRPSRPKMKGEDPLLPMWTLAADPDPLFRHRDTDWDGYVVYSDCVTWMLEKPIRQDALKAIVGFVPEIVWHAGIKSVPLQKMYDTLLECFDERSVPPVVLSRHRDQAYLSAKAVLHVLVQRKCLGDTSDAGVSKKIAAKHRALGPRRYTDDGELESTLGIIDQVLGKGKTIAWSKFRLSVEHHSWMAHILLYRAWDVLGSSRKLSDDVTGFVRYSLSMDPPPSNVIVADCLMMIGLLIGINIHMDDLSVVDKSQELEPHITRIFDRLTAIMKQSPLTEDQLNHAFSAMTLIGLLPRRDVTQKSYALFHVVMQTRVSYDFTTKRKWEAARLTLHGAYKWDKSLPWVKDPQDILTFLDHHFELASKSPGCEWDIPIQNALRALAYAPDRTTIDALSKFDPTEPSFIRGICYVYQQHKPFQLRKAALFFLPLIGDKWFNPDHPIMEPDQMRKFCIDWAHNVDGIEHTNDVQKAVLAVLFGMINSPHWRPHIVTKQWKLLEYFAAVPDDSQPLRRCLENPELMDVVEDVEDPVAMVLWLAILWLKYNELLPEVREQLEAATRSVAQGNRKTDLDMYLSIIDAEAKKAEEALKAYNTWSTDPAAIALRKKIDNIKQSKEMLSSVRELPSYTNVVAGPSRAPRE